VFDTKLGLYIDGEWVGPEGRETQDVLDPATGASHGRLPLATVDDLDRCVRQR
jgi:succinate-semialdehyde dehydrogenase/glutarate-semialdehyde dehydrogenase